MEQIKYNWHHSVIALIIGVALLFAAPVLLMAQEANENASADELEEKIEEHNERIEEINQEINQYESELDNTRDKKNTLKSTLSSLNNSIQQLKLRVKKTTRQISATENRIDKLENEIESTQQTLQTTRQSLAEAIETIHQASSRSLIEVLFSASSLSEALKTTDQLAQIQVSIRDRMDKIRSLKKQQEKQKKEAQQRRDELSALQSKLAEQRESLQAQKGQKQALLAKTNREERQYQKLLKKKREQKRQFEQQLQTFESRLESVVADDQVPSAQAVSFQWPVSDISITQQFGGTDFAERNPSAYGRPFHNGTDFGAQIGTPVQPTKAGIVRATGNTDTVTGCYSYGKWVLIDHGNLSTLYAHLSDIATTEGESVSTDSTIGYVGNTGYSTGPHLHLTTYIKDDVRIAELGDIKDQTNCGAATIPVAPQAGYLNPMKYLP